MRKTTVITLFILFIFTMAAILFKASRPCRTTRQPVKIIVDLTKNGGWALKQGDSIFWEQTKFIVDSSHGFFKYGHGLSLDTVYGLLHLKPLVIIFDDGDTVRRYFGDTLRYSTCDKKAQPQ